MVFLTRTTTTFTYSDNDNTIVKGEPWIDGDEAATEKSKGKTKIFQLIRSHNY